MAGVVANVALMVGAPGAPPTAPAAAVGALAIPAT